MSREHQIKKSVWQFAATYAIALSMLTWAEVSGHLAPRIMAFLCMVLAVAGFIFLTVRFSAIGRQYPSTEISNAEPGDPTTRKKIERNIRRYRRMIILLPLILAYALWTAWGGPVLPSITGAAVNLAFTLVFYLALRSEKAKLQQLNSNTTGK